MFSEVIEYAKNLITENINNKKKKINVFIYYSENNDRSRFLAAAHTSYKDCLRSKIILLSDMNLIRGIFTERDFYILWQEINNLSQMNNMTIGFIAFLGHSGPEGLFFKGDVPQGDKIEGFTLDSVVYVREIPLLPKLKWTKNGVMLFYSCNSEIVAQKFANTQKIVAIGQKGSVSFSEDRDQKNTDWFANDRKEDTLYLWAYDSNTRKRLLASAFYP